MCLSMLKTFFLYLTYWHWVRLMPVRPLLSKIRNIQCVRNIVFLLCPFDHWPYYVSTCSVSPSAALRATRIVTQSAPFVRRRTGESMLGWSRLLLLMCLCVTCVILRIDFLASAYQQIVSLPSLQQTTLDYLFMCSLSWRIPVC